MRADKGRDPTALIIEMTVLSSLAALALFILAPHHVAWLEEEVQFLISASERARFEELASDEERDRFIELFWLRRDPVPATLANEARDSHYARLAEADRLFTVSSGRGRFTERGRILILLGPPSFRESFMGGQLVPTELWHYTGITLPFLPDSFHLIFFRPAGDPRFRLFRPLRDGVSALLPDPEPGRFHLNSSYEELAAIDPELGAVVANLVTESVSDSERLLASLDGFPDLLERVRGQADSVRARASFRNLDAHLEATILEDDAGVSEIHYALELPAEESGRLRFEPTKDGVRRAQFTLVGRVLGAAREIERWEDVVAIEISSSAEPSRPLSFQGRRLFFEDARRVELTLVDEGGGVAFAGSDLTRVVLVRRTDAATELPRRFPFRVGNELLSPVPDPVVGDGSVLALVSISPEHRGGDDAVVELFREGERIFQKRVLVERAALIPLSLETQEAGRYRLRVAHSGGAFEREFELRPGQPSALPRVLVRESDPAEEVQYRQRRASSFLRRGEREPAITEMEIAVSVTPQNLRLQLELAALLYAEGRHDEVVTQLETARELLPADPDLFVLLAASSEALGRFGRAFELYEKAIELAPDDVGIQQALERVGARRRDR